MPKRTPSRRLTTKPTSATGPKCLTHTYNAAGQPQSGIQQSTTNGKADRPVSEVYTYTGDLLTKIEYFTATGATSFGFSTLNYDAAKRPTQLFYKNNSGGYSATNKYEYDANGNYTRYTYVDSDGTKNETVCVYDSSKNPEQIPAKPLLYNAFTNRPWRVNVAVTVKNTYDDGTGPQVSTGKRTNIKTDAKGYVISATYTEDGVGINETYTLADCN